MKKNCSYRSPPERKCLVLYKFIVAYTNKYSRKNIFEEKLQLKSSIRMDVATNGEDRDSGDLNVNFG